MNLERLIQMVLRVVVARGVGLVMNRATGWLERRGRGGASRGQADAEPDVQDGRAPKAAAPAPGLDAKRLRQQMRMISRIGRMR